MWSGVGGDGGGAFLGTIEDHSLCYWLVGAVTRLHGSRLVGGWGSLGEAFQVSPLDFGAECARQPV